MGLRYENLDDGTRRLMVAEIEGDIASRGVYVSNYLTDGGGIVWPDLLLTAARVGNDDTLARSLQGHFKAMTPRRTKSGTTMVRVPVTAAQTLAEAQFNMYYIRALCRRVIEAGGHVQVYRAKAVDVPRSESERMIGTTLEPNFVLQALRQTLGIDPPTGVPLPNTGITLRLA